MKQGWQPADRQAVVGLLDDPARAAAARAAVGHVQQGMVLGLGSGRALWATMELLGRRAELAGLSVVSASVVTERLARQYGFAVAELDGAQRPDLYIDGADEVAPDAGLLKGHGNALLREKLIAVAARSFVVVAEEAKLVEHLGQQRTLPIEVVRFGWTDTLRRLRDMFAEVNVRMDGGQPLVTDEGNHLLEIGIPSGVAPLELSLLLERTVGVVEHGLFLGMADEVLLGGADGGVDVLHPAAQATVRQVAGP
jgi:ribose 5-phosphate isomerase A